MNPHLPFAFRLALSIFLVGGVSTLLVTYLIYAQVKLVVWESMSSRLQDLNRFALSELKESHLRTIKKYKQLLDLHPVKSEYFHSLDKTNSIKTLDSDLVNRVQSSDDFQELVQYLRRVKFSTAKSLVPREILPQSNNQLDTPLIRYTYIAYVVSHQSPEEAVLRILADSDYQENDVNGNGIIEPDEASSEIGEIFLSDDGELFHEMNKGYVVSSRDYTFDRWGIWISSHGPIYDDSGQVIAFLGIDMNAGSEFNLLRNLRLVLMAVAFLSIILSFILGYFISRYFSYPIQNLIKGAEAVSQENYNFRIHVDTNDELGRLARTFNQMIDSVRNMRNNLTDVAKRLESEKEEANIQKKLSLYSEKRAEIELKKSENLNRMIQVVIESKSIDDLFLKIHDVMLEKYELSAFSVFLINENTDLLKLYKYFGNSHPGYLEMIFVQNLFIDINENNSIHAKCIKQNKSFLALNLKNRIIKNQKEINLVKYFNIVNCYIIPLVIGEQKIGTIAFMESEGEDFKLKLLSKSERHEIETFVKLISPSIEQVLQKDTIEKALTALQETSHNLLLERDKAKQAYEELEESMSYIARSDRMVTLGTMVAGVAHEINTPLGAIRANSDNIAENMKSLLSKLNPGLSNLTIDDLNSVFKILELSGEEGEVLSTKELRSLKKRIRAILEERNFSDSDNLADSIIELRLTEALEQGNTFFNSPKLVHYLAIASDIRGIQKKTKVNANSADRISKIVKSLKSYMHFQQNEEKVLGDINEGLDTVLTILHNKLKYGIEVTTKYIELPKFYCYPDELNQVWTNLIHNAIQAMNEKGSLLVEVSIVDGNIQNIEIDKRKSDYTGKYVAVSIQDSGLGIPQELRKKIFQAFFTTKKAGEGSGLGLHIIGKILDKHAGALSLESEPGRTRFTIYLPLLLELSV